MHNSAAVIPPLLEDGIRFLVYAGKSKCFDYAMLASDKRRLTLRQRW
jgi:hypothetical protein